MCVDASSYGNIARFVRRSCTPNAEVLFTLVIGVAQKLYTDIYVEVLLSVFKYFSCNSDVPFAGQTCCGE